MFNIYEWIANSPLHEGDTLDSVTEEDLVKFAPLYEEYKCRSKIHKEDLDAFVNGPNEWQDFAFRLCEAIGITFLDKWNPFDSLHRTVISAFAKEVLYDKTLCLLCKDVIVNNTKYVFKKETANGVSDWEWRREDSNDTGISEALSRLQDYCEEKFASLLEELNCSAYFGHEFDITHCFALTIIDFNSFAK